MKKRVCVLACMLLVLSSAVVCSAEEEGFYERVNKAIDKGMRYLLSRQEKDGSFGADPPGGTAYDGSECTVENHRIGICGLALYALLKSGVNPRHPVILRGFRYIDKHDNIRMTSYDLSLLIMALKAWYTPHKRRSLRGKKPGANRQSVPVKAKADVILPPKERKKLQAWVDRLIKRRMPYAWRYNWSPGEPDTRLDFNQDISSTQIALLALNAARSCRSIKIDPTIMLDVIDFCLDNQEAKGPEYTTKVPSPSGGMATLRGQVRGFSYNVLSKDKWEKRASGGMTAAGCGSLLICKSFLLDNAKYKEKYRHKVTQAIFDSMEWLNKHWTVKKNPCGRYYRYYYLYGIERVEISNRSFIGEHNWYKEGAGFLLGQQKPTGAWICWDTADPEDVLNTSFALLFLSRATKPIVLTRAK